MIVGSTFTALGGAAYSWRIEPVWLETVQINMTIPDLPADLAGFHIIQLSDPHIGSSVPLEYLGKWIDWINSRQADLVVITGDLIHYASANWCQPGARLLSRLQTREGIIAVLGNHDWASSSRGSGDAGCADRVSLAMASEGIRLLRNQSVIIRRGSAQLHVVGLDDYWQASFDPVSAFAAVPDFEPCIALVHNPDAFWDLLSTPATWTLAGHTHGGQVNLPLFVPLFVPVKHKDYIAGHYQLNGRNLYINRGIGWLRRVRLNARPEITEFTLTRA